MILKAANDPNIISFAGGLPNPTSFPTEAVQAAANKVFDTYGFRAIQYNAAEGFRPLKEKICARYKEVQGLDYEPEDVIITTGSQQGLDMLSAVFLDAGDQVLVENPTYLVALQVFHHYFADVIPVDLMEDGINVEQLAEVMDSSDPKFMYIIPNFQNPTGLTYTEEKRAQMAEVFRGKNTFIIEDNPYGELRFSGQSGHSLAYFLPEQVCMTGTFSKTVAPGMRIGWIATKNKELMAKMNSYKASMDIHSSILDQMIINQYLEDNDLNAQINNAKVIYEDKAKKMMAAMAKYMPEGVEFTKPEGGMFLWVTLPDGIKGVDVQSEAVKKGVLVLAGDPFYEKEREVNTMRVNFSNSSDEQIETGVKAFADTIREFMNK